MVMAVDISDNYQPHRSEDFQLTTFYLWLHKFCSNSDLSVYRFPSYVII